MPEIDHLYMSVCQAMTGACGWPLTIVMTPDKEPFFPEPIFQKMQKGKSWPFTTYTKLKKCLDL